MATRTVLNAQAADRENETSTAQAVAVKRNAMPEPEATQRRFGQNITNTQVPVSNAPASKAQKTTAGATASANAFSAAPMPLAPTSVTLASNTLRSAQPAPTTRAAAAAAVAAPAVLTGATKMPVLLIDSEVPLSQRLNDLHLSQVQALGIEDIHREDDQDAQEAKEYVVPAVSYMLQIEPGYQPDQSYILRQPDVSWKNRSTVVDWMCSIHWQYKWQAETLLLAVNVLDRYLSMKTISRSELQLVGAVSLLIACKYEQIYTPFINDFKYLCEDAYQKHQFIQMESEMLVKLKFKLGQPSAMTYLRRISKAENYDIATRTIAKYLVESSTLSEKFLSYTPSVVAAASILAARRMRNAGPWDATMTYYSGYSEAALEPCVQDMAEFLHTNTRYRAIFRKFAAKQFLRASQFVEQHLQRSNGRI